MRAAGILSRLMLLIGLSTVVTTPSATAQPALPAESQPTPPALRTLTGDDAKRAQELDGAVDAAVEADRWHDAIAKKEELLKLRVRVQGPKHFETVNAEWMVIALRRVATLPKDDRALWRQGDAMVARAEQLYAQGRYSEAEPLFEKELTILRHLFTDDHRHTANGYRALACDLAQQGKYIRAQPLFEKALEIELRLLTEDHPDLAETYQVLALNFLAQGKYAEAQPLFEKALTIARRLFGDDDMRTATAYFRLARGLYCQGKFAAAQPLFEKALHTQRRVFGDDHPDTGGACAGLALNLDAQAKYAQAQRLFEKSLQIERRLEGDDHPNTAAAYNNLALNLNHQSRYAQAQPLYEKALEIQRRVLTDDNPDTAHFYSNAAGNLDDQGKHAQAQRLHEKASEIQRRLLTDDHPSTAASYNNLGCNLSAQGKYAQAQALFERALEIRRRLLTDDHPSTAISYTNLAVNLNAQGKYAEAKNRWMSAVESLDAARLLVAFTGLERAGDGRPARPGLAAVLARLGQPSEAYQALEDDLGRGLLDELAARQDRQLNAAERTQLRQLTGELEKLDKLVESTPKGLDNAQRAKRFENLKVQRELTSISLGELHTKLVQTHGALAGQVAKLNEIQAALPSDSALVAWVDIPPAGPNATDPDGEHWGVVVRSRGTPAWVPITGTGKGGLWTADDTGLASRVRSELGARPGAGAADLMPLLDQLRTQRLAPLAKALAAATDGLPPARRLIILPSRAMVGIPVEALLAPDGTRTVSYVPSGTVFKYLREQPRPDRHAGLLALGDPVYAQPGKSTAPKPAPDHGLMLNVVARGSNAASHGLKDGDVLLAYNGHALNKKDDLKVVTEGGEPVPIEVWRDGVSSRQELSPGKLGVMIDPRPAREAINENRELQQVLAAARSGGENFSPLPGTRREVEAIAQFFKSDGRPTRALLGTDASEPQLERIAASGELTRFGFIHLAAHGVIDEANPARSAVILTQTGLPDPLEQALNHEPVFDGRLSVREIQHDWDLKAELVTLSACDTALGREAGGEGFVGFTQALLMSGARSVCLSLWKVDDTATALLMTRFYQNMLGKRAGLSKPLPKAEALREAKQWMRGLTRADADAAEAGLPQVSRGEVRRRVGTPVAIHPYEHPHFWAAFILTGDPD